MVERLAEPQPDGRRYRLTVDLPPDFQLNQPLSTFALAAIDLLDRESDTYALDVVSVIEATLDDPRQILAAQLNKAKGEAVAQMKAEGIEYEERMELLEEISYPQPLAELLEHALEVYTRSNPWAADAHLSPKSVVRDVWENAYTFRELVNTYGLTRAEGAVLRYLSDAYKALRSGVPAAARTDEVTDLVEWLGELDRGSGWDAERWGEVVQAYFSEHAELSTGADARGPALLIWDKSEPGVWRVRQILDDPAGHHDWGFDVEVDLEASDEEGAVVMRLVDAGRTD